MKYIDVVVVLHNESSLDIPLMPTHVEKVLTEAGFTVRSTTVLDANTGLTGSFRPDGIQHKIDKENGR